MDFKLLKQAVSNLNWKLDYFEFCELLLGKKQKRELLIQDKYCLKKWHQWQLLNNALEGFTEDDVDRIISVYEQYLQQMRS